ncbi:Doublecortin [Necator americanus]|uniref:Doublecortin n=1 Tax=Necator americanus TaxID=51031 RepID=W2SLS2_NECAM|nr:Doublecortin [Necator americanus]ETN70493.1 Doublecortin [Necator americanus]
MAKERSSSVRRPIETSLSNSFSSSAASSLSSSNYGVKTVRIFKNGDPYHQGLKVVLNRRYVHDLDGLLASLSEKLDLTYGAKRLYTVDGKLVKHFQDIEDKQDYVAATNHFIPQQYGKWSSPAGHPLRVSSSISPQTRASRSQTRTNESKPTTKKRALSGVVPIQTATSGTGPSPTPVAQSKKQAADGKKEEKER